MNSARLIEQRFETVENKRRPAGNRASNPAGLSNGASRMIIAPLEDGSSKAHRPGRSNISAYRRRLIYERDQYQCQQCGDSYREVKFRRVLRAGKWRTHGLEIDHIVPVKLGGTNAVSNLQALCTPCNARKGAGA